MIDTANAAPQEAGDKLGEKRRKFRAFEENKRREIDEQRLHRRYYYDKQWSDEEIRKLRQRGQQPTVRNKIARKIDFLVGVEQRMRRDPKAYPRGPEDQQGADVVTATLRYVCDNERWEHKSSGATADALMSGIGVAFVGVEMGRRGPEVKIRQVQADRFFYDPRAEQPDFSDARFMGISLWMDKEEAKARWPEMADQVEDLVGIGSSGQSSLAAEEDRNEQWADYEHQRVRVCEWWEKQADGAWYYCFFTGDVEFESGVSPYMDEDDVPMCPYIAWSPKVDEVGDRHGLIRSMLTIQDEINHRASRILHRLQSRQMYVREGVVDDIDELKRQMTRPDGVVEINGGVWGQDIGPIDNGQQINGEAELLTLAQSDIENLGPNPGLIGQGGGVADQSGRAILAQRDSGMTELSPIFERLRDWKLRCYRAIWNRVRQFWTGEKYIRITDNPDAPNFIGINQVGIDPQTGMLQSQNMLAELDVDIILDEGPDTITMQEELLERLAQLGEAAMSPLGKLLIELSNIPQKERYLQMFEQAQPEPDPIEQEAQKMELRERNAKVSKIELEAQEKASQIPLNQARAAKEAAQAEQMANPYLMDASSLAGL